MTSFTPPTYNERHAPPGADRLWSRVSYPRGYTVLIEGSTVSTFPGLAVVDSDRFKAATYAYMGGHIYPNLTGTEVTLLTNAGYGAFLA